MIIDFEKISAHESALIEKISNRAKEQGHPDSLITISLDIMAAHIYTPLKLDELLNARTPDFLHDVFGIREHISRQTGKLEGPFYPRFALKQ